MTIYKGDKLINNLQKVIDGTHVFYNLSAKDSIPVTKENKPRIINMIQLLKKRGSMDHLMIRPKNKKDR